MRKMFLLLVFVLCGVVSFAGHYDYGRMERHSSQGGGSSWGIIILIIILGAIYLIYRRNHEQ